MSEQQTVWVVSNIDKEKLLPLLVDQVSELKKLPETPPYALILSKNAEQNWLSLLRELRSNKNYRYTPVFYHGDIEPHLEQLFDGMVNEEVEVKAALIHERIKGLSEAIIAADDKESILLSYLYSRAEVHLQGYKNSLTPFIYSYPLLDVLFPTEPTFDEWRFLEDLVTRDLLMHEELIDEIQVCSACESGLLNFKTTCPSCHSIDIKPQKFVHCFHCGRIGPVPEFLRQERLICSRCHAKLHELNIDYEKPIEDKICNTCGHFFADADVGITCLVCHRISHSPELNSRRLYNYQITKRTEYLVRGIEKSIYHNFNHFFKVIDYSIFMSIVSWQVKLAKRYAPVYFSIMTLQIMNEDELVSEKGEANSELLMGQFFTILRQAFRESDLSSRLEGTMFFLIPMADQDGCMVILERIKQAVLQLEAEGIGTGFTVGVSYMTSAEIIKESLEADLVPAELQARILENNVCFIRAK